MSEILFIIIIILINLFWFIFYLMFVEKLPWVKILVFSLINLIIITTWNGREYFLQHAVYVIFGSILLGAGIAGFIEYVKNLYKNYKNGNLSFKSILPIVLYIWMCAVTLGLVQK